jgi:hypothetical protein
LIANHPEKKSPQVGEKSFTLTPPGIPDNIAAAFPEAQN